MTSPQDPPRRRKQKARRTKQLDAWREKNAATKTAQVSEGTKATKKA